MVTKIIPTLQATALISHNVSKLSSKKKISTKDILGLGVTNVVGTSLIQATAGITSGL